MNIEKIPDDREILKIETVDGEDYQQIKKANPGCYVLSLIILRAEGQSDMARYGIAYTKERELSL